MSKNLFCKMCLLQFDKKIVYDIHMSFVHKMEQSKSLKNVEALIKEKECSICQKSFYTKHTLKRHIEAVHEGKKPHKCSWCDASFSTNSCLTRHTTAFHQKHELFKCDAQNLLKNYIQIVRDGNQGKKSDDHNVSEITNESENNNEFVITNVSEITNESIDFMEDSNQPEENPEKSIVINFEEDSVGSPENPEEI